MASAPGRSRHDRRRRWWCRRSTAGGTPPRTTSTIRAGPSDQPALVLSAQSGPALPRGGGPRNGGGPARPAGADGGRAGAGVGPRQHRQPPPQDDAGGAGGVHLGLVAATSAGTNKVAESILLVTALVHGKILSCIGRWLSHADDRPILNGSPFGGSPDPLAPPVSVLPDRAPHQHDQQRRLHPAGRRSGRPVDAPDHRRPRRSGRSRRTLASGRSSARCRPISASTGAASSSGSRASCSRPRAGKYWWLLRRLLRLGLDLIQLASTQGAANLAVLEKLRAGTLTSADIQAIPPQNNFTLGLAGSGAHRSDHLARRPHASHPRRQ